MSPDQLPSGVDASTFKALLSSIPGKGSGSATTLVGDNSFLSVHRLPSKISRHNTPLRTADVTFALSAATVPSTASAVSVRILVDSPSDCSALAVAATRAFPSFSLKSEVRVF